MPPQKIDFHKPRRVLRGPLSFFDNSFIVEILEMEPSLQNHCSLLLRATYKTSSNPLFHPSANPSKTYPQIPPLHLHFNQIETFKILSGKMGCIVGWEQEEVILTKESGALDLGIMVPHQPFPVVCEEEDTVAILAVHPRASEEEEMDEEFFEGLFGYFDRCWRTGERVDLVRVCVWQHASASAPVILPHWAILGPLRWWLPWKLQACIAWIGRKMGYTTDMREFLKEQ